MDYNSLYASCMVNPLPIGEVSELAPTEVRELEKMLMTVDVHGERGYYLLIDTYQASSEVAKATDEFPLTLQHMDITPDMLSTFSKNLLRDQGRKPAKRARKLIASHLPARELLISLELLQVLIRHGLQVAKIHTAFSFKQEPFLESFIKSNIDKRARTDNDTLKAIYKLINNSIYGKLLINESAHNTSQYLSRTAATFIKYVSKTTFKSITPLGPGKAIITSQKPSVQLTQPTHIGFSILERAKSMTYSFWYDIVKPQYGRRAELCYMDTDSFIFTIDTCNLEHELQEGPLSEVLDLSNFPPNHRLYDESKKGKLGYLKIETGAKLIQEAVFLRPKLYSLLLEDDSQMSGAKGIAKREKDKVTHDQFRNCLYNNSSTMSRTSSIRNIRGQMVTTVGKKLALTSYDDKRYYVSNQESYGYGHPTALRLIKEERERRNQYKPQEEEEEEEESETEEWTIEDEISLAMAEIAEEMNVIDEEDVAGNNSYCYEPAKKPTLSELYNMFKHVGVDTSIVNDMN